MNTYEDHLLQAQIERTQAQDEAARRYVIETGNADLLEMIGLGGES